MDEYLLLTTTTERREDAERIAARLVSDRLAACVQIAGPITSTYWWKGKIETASEWLCLIKTRRVLYPAVEAAIRAVHPYEVPEIVALPIVAGSRAYLEWIRAEVRDAGDAPASS